jgi:hypothetical protein
MAPSSSLSRVMQFFPRRIRRTRRLLHSIDDWFLHIVLVPFFLQYHTARRMGVKKNHVEQSGLDLTDEERRLTFFFCFTVVAFIYSSVYYSFSFCWVLYVRVPFHKRSQLTGLYCATARTQHEISK